MEDTEILNWAQQISAYGFEILEAWEQSEGIVSVTLTNGEKFHYPSNKKFLKIIFKGKDQTRDIESLEKTEIENQIAISYVSNSQTYISSYDKFTFSLNILHHPVAKDCFQYFLKIAEKCAIKDEKTGKVVTNLLERYENDLAGFVDENSVMAQILLGELKSETLTENLPILFPFGFNISQKEAVEKAFSNSLSVIEGPPGTGKTQTILNIIANAVMRGERVAVISNNNAATENVFEKLKKHDLEFIAAFLGKTKEESAREQKENSEIRRSGKEIFIDDLQTRLPQELPNWKLSEDQENEVYEKLAKLFDSILLNLKIKNELSDLQQNLSEYELEYHDFCGYLKDHRITVTDIVLQEELSSKKIKELIDLCFNASQEKRPCLLKRILLKRFNKQFTQFQNFWYDGKNINYSPEMINLWFILESYVKKENRLDQMKKQLIAYITIRKYCRTRRMSSVFL